MIRCCLWSLLLLGPISLALAGDESSAAKQPLDLAASLQKATVNGTYAMLLRQIRVPEDEKTEGAFNDLGRRDLDSYKGHTDLPRGYWVYVAPYWYIWRERTEQMRPLRAWGPEQLVGPPNVWPLFGDIQSAWASQTEDTQDEWLLLEYAQPVFPRALLIYETFNPGAVERVTAFKLDGEEVEVWKGTDPTPVGDPKGISVIPFRVNFKVARVKLYLSSTKVGGWNEIDAVGLRDTTGKTHWVHAAAASSTYATDPVPVVDNQTLMLNRLEEDIRTLKARVKRLEDRIKARKKQP